MKRVFRICLSGEVCGITKPARVPRNTPTFALIYAGAMPRLDQIKYVIALLPYTEGEKPRFEDRTKVDSQRVWLARILLNRMNQRCTAVVKLALDVLRGTAPLADPLYLEVLAGTNLDRPRSEHGRPFPVVKQLEPEQALHLLACLAEHKSEVPEELLIPRIHSENHRERIDAAVILRRLGFSKNVEPELLAEITKPYQFREIFSIGKGRFDLNFRDKAYLLMALAAHTSDLAALNQFTDYTRYYRDIRIGLAIGLGFRGTPDAYPLLQKLAQDPIYVVHRLCWQAEVEIRDAELVAGRTAPALELPGRAPLRPEYSAPGSFVFADKTLDPIALPGSVTIDPQDPRAAIVALKASVDQTAYQNVGNTFARNAERMRIFDAGELAKVLESPSVLNAPTTPELEQSLIAALDSPYPFAHYLARWLIALRGEQKLAAHLVQKLPEYVAAADTVGFYWVADTLGRLHAVDAIAPLKSYALEKEFPKTYGSIWMAYGFSAK